MNGVTHIVGLQVQVGPFLRQRCGWCGAILIDYDLNNVAVPVGQEDSSPSVWPVGALVTVDGPVTVLLDHPDGAILPDGACGKLDPAATR